MCELHSKIVRRTIDKQHSRDKLPGTRAERNASLPDLLLRQSGRLKNR